MGLISKKSNFARAAHFFVHFFTVVLNDYNVKLPETSQLHVLLRKCRTCSCSLFFHCRSFSSCIGDRQHFSFFHRRYNKKNVFFAFFSRSRSPSPLFSLSFAGLPPTFSFSRLSFSCSIFQICGHDNGCGHIQASNYI